MLPIVVRDFQVLSHAILNRVPQVVTRLGSEDHPLYKQWVKSCWAVLLNRAPDTVKDQPISNYIVNDHKADHGYWRHTYLADWVANNFPEEDPAAFAYKAGRAEKPQTFQTITGTGLSYCAQLSLPVYSREGYEADDLAATLVKIKKTFMQLGIEHPLAASEIWLHTVDCDWLQLVSPGVRWMNTAIWVPRIRDEAEAIDYIIRKSKAKTRKSMGGIKHPWDIVRVKVIEGDSSDNLKAGKAPVEVIDLMNPPSQFDLMYQPEVLRDMLQRVQTHDNRNKEHYTKAVAFLLQAGLPAPCSLSAEAQS